MGRLPAVYINHGGGPLPLLGQQPNIAQFLSSYASTLHEKPRAVVVVTAHWEAPVTTVSASASHPLLFDYGGFPAESYQLKYPAPGSPEVAERVCHLLNAAGLENTRDLTRGWDHGVFVPMMLMFPAADVPIVQLSLTRDQDPEKQLAVGKALEPLRDEGVLIVGSGASFHNFKYMFARDSPTLTAGAQHSRAFDDWLTETMTSTALPTKERHARLVSWERAPSATYAHPQGAGEHFLPAIVIAGAGGEKPAVKVGSAPGASNLVFSQFEFNQ